MADHDHQVDLKKLDQINVYTPEGTKVSLLSLWDNRPAVVAFTRHFGCLLCRKRMSILESRKAEMDAAGVALISITPGKPEQARKFLDDFKFSGEVYVDPGHESYNALEFVKGISCTAGQKGREETRKAKAEGYKIDWSLVLGYGDTMWRGIWQQGGILVAGPGAETVKFFFKDNYAGDEPQIEKVISACCT